MISSALITENFDEPVLYAPCRTENNSPCDKLRIITGFTDCERISTHAIALQEGVKNHRFIPGVSIDIILGMTKSSLTQKKHEDICRLLHFLNTTPQMPKVSCRYIASGKEVHSKVYVWHKKESDGLYVPVKAYAGSLNYTSNAFYKRREVVSECNAAFAGLYYLKLLPDTIDCYDPDVSTKLQNIVNGTAVAIEDPDNTDNEYEYYNAMQPEAVCKISLLTAAGETGYGSGINWGIRPNGTKRNPNQAYIPYNAADKVPGFFPDRLNPADRNCPMFKVVTKDFGVFHMRLAQDNNKAIHSVESNSILGEYIRKKIGCVPGGFVTRQMLEHYGSTTVQFRKYSDGTYLLDF